MRSFVLLLFFTSLISLAQTRIIPHVTRADGGFTTHLQLINPTNEALAFDLQPYAQNGALLPLYEGRLEPFESMNVSTTSLFGEDASHVMIPDNNSLEILVAYRDAEQLASSAHVPVATETAFRWLMLPGEDSDVIDGIAVLNTGTVSLPIYVRQVDSNQNEIQREMVFELDSYAKGLYIFQDFQSMPGTHFEIFADGPLALTALRFAASGPRYFWQTAAAVLPQWVEPENSAPVIIGQVPLSVEQDSRLQITLDHLMIEDADGDLDFSLMLADGDNYSLDGQTVIPNSGFSGSLSVPATVSDGQATSEPFNLTIEVTMSVDPRVGLSVNFPPNSTYGVSGRAVISDERTISITNFNYDGRAPDVRLYLGKNGDYANGIELTGVLGALNNASLSFELPAGASLDDFDGISVWCTVFLIDFSSGIFQ